MNIKFVINCKEFNGVDYSRLNFYCNIKHKVLVSLKEATMFDSYVEAEGKLQTFEPGIYQIDKIFIKQ